MYDGKIAFWPARDFAKQTMLFFGYIFIPVLLFRVTFHLLFSHCPQEYAMSNDFISKRVEKKTTSFSRTAIWQDSFQCFYPPPSNFPFRSPLRSRYVAADRSHTQELEYSDRPNVLTASEFSAWLIPFRHPTSPLPNVFPSFLRSPPSFAIHISSARGNGLLAYLLN